MLRLIINLDRSIDRWQRMESQFQTLGISSFQRISAIDAKKDELPMDCVAPLGSPKKYFVPRELTRGEVACYLSHIKCWKTLLNSDEHWAVIFEDDIQLSERSKNFILSESWIPPSIHIAQLHTFFELWHCRTFPKYLPLEDGSFLHNVIEPSYGSCCYLIDRKAAKTALDLSQQLAAPLDEFLFNFKSPFTQKFPAMRLNPACVLHNDNGHSTIGEKRFSHKQAYSLRNRLSLKRLYWRVKKKFLEKFVCVDTVFTWK